MPSHGASGMNKAVRRRVPAYPRPRPSLLQLSARQLDGYPMASSMISTDALAPERRKLTRSSLACLPCRSRHLKCDGKKPECSRCTQVSKQCYYAESRRGGLDRAALAERRKRLAAAAAVDHGDSSQTESPKILTLSQPNYEQLFLNGVGVADTPSSGSAAPVLPNTGMNNIEDDALLDAYYENFHTFHPLALPRSHLARFYHDPRRPINLTPLIAVMRCIGHLYRFKQWSDALRSFVEISFSEASPKDPLMVQCRLLYSSALFWYEYKNESKQEMDHAADIAVEIGMYRRDFASEHGLGDPVLTESWRRTWWSLYVVEGYYAGTLGTMDFKVINVEATVDLPCQESEYESGVSTPC